MLLNFKCNGRDYWLTLTIKLVTDGSFVAFTIFWRSHSGCYHVIVRNRSCQLLLAHESYCSPVPHCSPRSFFFSHCFRVSPSQFESIVCTSHKDSFVFHFASCSIVLLFAHDYAGRVKLYFIKLFHSSNSPSSIFPHQLSVQHPTPLCEDINVNFSSSTEPTHLIPTYPPEYTTCVLLQRAA